jgi:hypothetical protein
MSYFVTNHALVTDHFGSWPSFHDAEIVRLTIDRSTEDMHIDIITFLMTKETDAKGNFKRDKECTIRFKLQGI